MRRFFPVFLLASILITAAFVPSCSSGKHTNPASDTFQVRATGIPSGTDFNTERDLLTAALQARVHPIEIVFFDSGFTLLDMPKESGANISNTPAGVSLEQTLDDVSGNAFMAVVFDPQRYIYAGSGQKSGASGKSVTLIANPLPGAVTAGIAVINGETESFEFVIELVRGASNANRIALKAPSGSHNQVDDLTVTIDVTDKILEWTEKNIGDYGNDGEVGIPDITPIALNYAKAVNHADPNDTAAMIDGDLNGEIGISDITPIALNYLNLVSGYNVYRFQSGVSGWELLAMEPRPLLDPAWHPPSYDFADSDVVVPNTYYAVLPVDSGGTTGEPSIVVGIPGASEALKPGPPDGTTGPGNTVDLQIAGVKDFSVEPDGTAEFDLKFTNPDSAYVIALMNIGGPSTQSETITIGFGGSGTVSSIGPPKSFNPEYLEVDVFEQRLRKALAEQEAYLLRHGKRPENIERSASALGDSRNFNIVFADLNPNTVDAVITARLRAENAKVRLWVDEFVDDGRLTPAQLSEIASDAMNVILLQEETAFGSMYDVDEDDILDVLFTPHINALPSRILGLFVSNDLQDTVGTNSADVIYLQVPDMLDGDPPTPIPPGIFDAQVPVTDKYFEDNVRQIIAHELQHLLSFGNRLKIRDAQAEMPVVEDLWLNEGLSHFSEDFIGFQGHANLTGVQQWLEATYAHPVFWPPELDGPLVRGGTYLFLRHFFERKGTAAVSKLLHRDVPSLAFAGISNVENASGVEIEVSAREWLGAMAFVGYEVNPASPYNYNDSAPHPETGGKSGVDFLSPYTDYRGLTQFLPRPLTMFLGSTPLSLDVKPNTAVFVIVTSNGETSRRISISSGASGVAGVFARVHDGSVTPEAALGPTPFEFFKLYSGRIDSNSDSDDFSVLITDGGTCFIRAVSSNPGDFAPEIRVNGDVYSDVNPLPGADLKYLLFPPGAGLVTISVSGAGGATGDYLLSAEFYPE